MLHVHESPSGEENARACSGQENVKAAGDTLKYRDDLSICPIVCMATKID